MIPEITRVSIDDIDTDDFKNCRPELTKIDELAGNIKDHGLLHPLTVREIDGTYFVRAGFRRFEALKSLHRTEVGFDQIPVRVLEGDEKNDGVINLGENITHESLNWRHIANAVARLHDDGHTVEELAEHFKKSTSWIGTRIIIAKKLSPLVQAAVEGEYLTVTDALQFAGLAFAEQEEKLEAMLDNPKAYQEMKEKLKRKRDPRPGIKDLRLRAKEVREYDQEEDPVWRAGVIQGLMYAQGADVTIDHLYHPPVGEE